MASLFKTGENRWSIDVYQRGRLRLGKNRAYASEVHRHVQALEDARRHGLSAPAQTKLWVRELGGPMRERLIVLRLIDADDSATLRELCDWYLNSLHGKRSTLKSREQTTECLQRYFSPDTPVSDIQSPDAQAFRAWLVNDGRKPRGTRPRKRNGLATATVSRRIKQCRSIFSIAVGKGWMVVNPFADITAGKQTNPDRQYFVTRELTSRVMDDLTTQETRLVFALARWGGLRVPSEALQLRWDGIDWHRRSMTFRVPKTEHYEGKETRRCPIFPELMPHLDTAWAHAPPAAEWVCPWLRSVHAPAASMTRAIQRALNRLGEPTWPKLLLNLRATRATEVEDEYGAKAESEWIGHGVSVAMRHYLMVTDEKWRQATGLSPEIVADDSNLPSAEVAK